MKFKFTNTILGQSNVLENDGVVTADEKYESLYGVSTSTSYIRREAVDAPQSPNASLFRCELDAMARGKPF
jgi:hypothetical protein